ncbi:MAG: ArnT family glycosyltransferase [Aquificaceae bacterium]
MISFILLSLYFFVFGNWFLGFTSLDEGRNMDAVLNMIKDGNFLIPYYNCSTRFEKPPLLYWMVLISSHLFGMSEFSARLISGLSAVGVALFTYMIAKGNFGDSLAKGSFLILLTFPHLWIESRAVVPEMLLNFFMIGGLYFFLKKRTSIGWLFIALAFLTKGPVGVLLPLGVYILWKRDLKVFTLKGLFIFLLLGGSWYFFMLYKFGHLYFYKFFIYENLMRYTGQRRVHNYPFYYYLIIILASTAFYIPLYPKLIRALRGELLPHLFWFFYVLIFFSLAKNRLHHYLLFSYPPLAIMLSYCTTEKYIKRVTYLAFPLLLVLLSYSYLYEKDRFTPRAYPIVKDHIGDVYFYRSEDSALVFYSQRCIKFLEKPDVKKGALIVTKEEYTFELPSCSALVKGKEFDGNYVLLECK